MSNDIEDQELKELEQQIEQAAADEKATAATAVIEPEPQPEALPESAPDAQAQPVQAPVAQTPAPATPNADDPLSWAKKKGLTSPEAMARSLQSMEEEFHRRNQAGHPGYRDVQNGNPAPQPPPPPPNWQPTPQAPAYGYPQPNYAPPPPSRAQITQELARETGIEADDIERIMPLIVKVANATSQRDRQMYEAQLADIRRQADRSAELAQLMQDPAFSDPRVQKEMHDVLKDGSLFQRGGRAHTQAFQIALQNLARKQLQQGVIPERSSNNPPVTAGGGNGSANTAPFKVTEAVFASWTEKERDAFILSNGRTLPKR